MSNILLGGDPEYFFTRGGIPFPACGLIGGDKYTPLATPHGGILQDNVTGETVFPPQPTRGGFIKAVKGVQSDLAEVAQRHGMGLDLIRSSYDFDERILDYFGNQARQFGCEKDFNAYTGKANPTPDSKANIRTCAGHVHVGYDCDQDDIEEKRRFIHHLDYITGKWCVENDPDLTRMSRYGAAGAFRPKPYGVEYRVPSNFWCRTSELIGMMYDSVHEAYASYTSNAIIPEPLEIQRMINEAGGIRV